MEIELNLVDDDYQPHIRQRRGAGGDRRPRVPDRAGAVQHRAQRPPAPAARRLGHRARGASCGRRSTPPRPGHREGGSGSSSIGILPTIMPEHFTGDWISANNRYTALSDSIFCARGEDIYLDIEGPTRGADRDQYCRLDRPGVGVHVGPAAPPGATAATSPPTGTRPRHSSAPSSRSGANSPFFFGKRAAGREPDRAVQQADRHPLDRAEEPGRPAPRVLRRAVDHLDLRPLRGERPLLPGAAAGVTDEDPVADVRRRSRRRTLAELRLHNGTVYRWNRPIYDIVERHARTCGWRTGCCRPARPSST